MSKRKLLVVQEKGKYTPQQIRFEGIQKDVSLMRKQTYERLQRAGTMNHGDKVEVDYFPLTHLLSYFEEMEREFQKIVKTVEIWGNY